MQYGVATLVRYEALNYKIKQIETKDNILKICYFIYNVKQTKH